MAIHEKIPHGVETKTKKNMVYFRIWKRNSREYYAGVRPIAYEAQEQALTMTLPW